MFSDLGQVLGIVKDGSFVSVDTKKTMLLTTVHVQEARTPESGKIDLDEYEGKAIMVSSQRIEGDIAYAAKVVDVADWRNCLISTRTFKALLTDIR